VSCGTCRAGAGKARANAVRAAPHCSTLRSTPLQLLPRPLPAAAAAQPHLWYPAAPASQRGVGAGSCTPNRFSTYTAAYLEKADGAVAKFTQSLTCTSVKCRGHAWHERDAGVSLPSTKGSCTGSMARADAAAGTCRQAAAPPVADDRGGMGNRGGSRRKACPHLLLGGSAGRGAPPAVSIGASLVHLQSCMARHSGAVSTGMRVRHTQSTAECWVLAGTQPTAAARRRGRGQRLACTWHCGCAALKELAPSCGLGATPRAP